MYGHSWSSEVSPTFAIEVNDCARVFVFDADVIMEDEYLTVVDGWMASDSRVYANVSDPGNYMCSLIVNNWNINAISSE